MNGHRFEAERSNPPSYGSDVWSLRSLKISGTHRRFPGFEDQKSTLGNSSQRVSYGLVRRRCEMNGFSTGSATNKD